MATSSAQYLSELHQKIDQYFSLEEVKQLCFELNVDYENIPGDTRSAFIRNLLVSLAKHGRLQQLIPRLRQNRPHVVWHDVPPDFELPQEIAEENIQQVVHYNVYGDYVHGDKVGGDKITTGNITGSQGIALGRDASATVTQTRSDETAVTPQVDSLTPLPHSPASVQETVNNLKPYLAIATSSNPETAVELERGVDLILQIENDPTHRKLLCLGLSQHARSLAVAVPGLVERVEQFTTAVLNQ